MQEDINEIIQMLGEEELSDDYSKQKLIRKESPAHKVVITSGEIEEAGYRTLGEILDYVNGMYAVSDKNYTHIGVRGFNRPSSNNNHIQVLVDGHPLNEGVYGGAGFGHDMPVPLSMIDRVEVIFGSSYILYGANALMARLNIVTKAANKEELFTAKVSLGSFDSFGLTLLSGRTG